MHGGVIWPQRREIRAGRSWRCGFAKALQDEGAEGREEAEAAREGRPAARSRYGTGGMRIVSGDVAFSASVLDC